MMALVYLFSLPLAVWVIAGCFAFLDFSSASEALIRTATRLLVLVALLALLDPVQHRAVAAAFATVVFLHGVMFAATRWAISSGRWIIRRIE